MAANTASSGSARNFRATRRKDDADSLTFDTPALVTDMDIVGQPVVELEFSVDKPVALVAVRLNDVWPTGEVSRITYHLQNLCMRDSRESPTPLEPGKRYKMKIKLDDIAWRVPKGHKIRVAISTTYFPMMWPAPEPVTLTVYAGKSHAAPAAPQGQGGRGAAVVEGRRSRRARRDEGAESRRGTSARR